MISEPLTFYTLINLEKGCSRRNLFRLEGIKGVSQYFQNRKAYEQNQIYHYLIEKFKLDASKVKLQEIDESFLSRLIEEPTQELIHNLELLIEKHGINFNEINQLVLYPLDSAKIEIYIDGIGTFEGVKSIFKFNFTTRFSRNDALELVCSHYALNNVKSDIQKLITLFLGSGMYREVYKEGDKTKSGALDKRGLAPWNKLREEANEILLRSYEKVKEMKKNPESFNIPEFGPCGTCPYHNIEVNYKGMKVICTG